MSDAIKIWAISDLHLSEADPARKRMSVFGPAWEGHPESLFERWDELVGEDDWVLVPGDVSWAHREGELIRDFSRIDRLPGRKLISPGNHDFGPWATQSKIERFAEPCKSIQPLKRGALRLDASEAAPGLVVACAKGAIALGDRAFGSEIGEAEGESDARKRFLRESGRLRFALREADDLRQGGDRLVVAIHYPPFVNLDQSSAFSDLIESSGAELCVFGHLHGADEHQGVIQGLRNGVDYRLVGCDALEMNLLLLGVLSADGFSVALG